MEAPNLRKIKNSRTTNREMKPSNTYIFGWILSIERADHSGNSEICVVVDCQCMIDVPWHSIPNTLNRLNRCSLSINDKHRHSQIPSISTLYDLPQRVQRKYTVHDVQLSGHRLNTFIILINRSIFMIRINRKIRNIFTISLVEEGGSINSKGNDVKKSIKNHPLR